MLDKPFKEVMPCDAANVTYNVIYTVLNYSIVSYTDEIYLEICTVNDNANDNANDNVNYNVMNSVNYNSHLQCMLTVIKTLKLVVVSLTCTRVLGTIISGL